VRDDPPSSILSRQREYVDNGGQREIELGLVVPEAFVRGIRHIGYKSNVEALAELIDNSIQAYAERIDLVLGYTDGASSVKPNQLAVIDNGHGMDPGMLRLAMMWGGTHRENDRNGLGRFGYGLPCATVSMGRRFTIFSKLRGRSCYSVSLDLDLLDNGSHRIEGPGIAIPAAQPAVLPGFVAEAMERNFPQGWESGTVVVIDKLDKLDWTTASGLRRNLLRHFGVTYHKLLTATVIYVDSEEVLPIDPLFLNPDGELHALDMDRAQALDPLTLSIDCGEGVSGDLRLRYSWLPPTFGATDKSRDAIGLNANDRFPIMKAYHGVVFSRNGRVVDVQSRTPWTTFINNDRYIRVEVEFSASLDEAFGVTTSKQQVSLSPDMWNQLQTAGLPKAIEHLRSKVRTAKTERQRTPSESVVVQSAHVIALRNTQTASAPEIAVKSVSGDCSKRDELLTLLRDAIDAADQSPALSALLKRVERRALDGDAWLIAEYRRLLKGWVREMSRAPH
jgi:Histidine kinase-, DNA gyrase B-, and HSP90-like ATPase